MGLLLIAIFIALVKSEISYAGWKLWNVPKDIKTSHSSSCVSLEGRTFDMLNLACPKEIIIPGGSIVIKDLGMAIAEEKASRKRATSFFDTFRTLDEINAQVALYAQTYPSVVKVSVIGTSLQGRNITLVRLVVPTTTSNTTTTTTPSGGAPVVLINSQVHAREWISVMTTMYTMDQIIQRIQSTSETLIRSYEWQFIPVLNPDGYVYSWTTDRLWRKNRSVNTGGCFGTDLNRNFAYKWGTSGDSTDPCSDVFRGTSAGSEVETQVLQTYLQSVGSRTQVFIDVHSYATSWMSVYGYATDTYPSNYAYLYALMQAAQTGAKVNGLTFSIGTDANVLSASSGGTDDYAYAVAKIPAAFTVELRGNTFLSPTSDIVPSGQEFLGGLLSLAARIGTSAATNLLTTSASLMFIAMLVSILS